MADQDGVWPGDRARLGRRTPQRVTVLSALIGCGDFVSAQALHLRPAATGSGVGLSTVYRTLTALADAGRADVVRDQGGERLFRHRPSDEHRHYLLCRSCGQGIPVDAGPVEDWARNLAASSGYDDVRHTLELTGTCPACRTGGGAPEDRVPTRPGRRRGPEQADPAVLRVQAEAAHRGDHDEADHRALGEAVPHTEVGERPHHGMPPDVREPFADVPDQRPPRRAGGGRRRRAGQGLSPPGVAPGGCSGRTPAPPVHPRGVRVVRRGRL
jgi:Fur family ferric uptake transcriptional regulator